MKIERAFYLSTRKNTTHQHVGYHRDDALLESSAALVGQLLGGLHRSIDAKLEARLELIVFVVVSKLSEKRWRRSSVTPRRTGNVVDSRALAAFASDRGRSVPFRAGRSGRGRISLRIA